MLSPVRLGLVRGDSMGPTMQNGQLYAFDRFPSRAAGVRRGEVVLFKHDRATYVKRVFAVAGDTVILLKSPTDEQAELLADWQIPGVQRLLRHRVWSKGMRLTRERVPPGHVFLVGDNLASSVDSRAFGAVPLTAVQGRVLFSPPPRADWLKLAVHIRHPHS